MLKNESSKKEWVGLTEDEFAELFRNSKIDYFDDFIEEFEKIESKLKEKNT